MKDRFNVGEPFETTVVAVAGDTVFIDLSAKSEGLVDAADFTDAEGNVTVKEGDKVTVYFTGDVRGEMHFTAKLAGQKADTSMLENAFKNQIPVEGSVQGEIKGGFEVKSVLHAPSALIHRWALRTKKSLLTTSAAQ